MSIVSIVQEFPVDLQPSMFRLMEALDRDLREKYAVRREDFDELRATVQSLVEAQRHTEERVEELAEAQRRTEVRVEELAERMLQMTDRLDRIDNSLAKATGWRLEQSYREKAHAYFGRVLRRVNVVSFHEIEDKVEELPPSERDSILLLDLIVRGRPRTVDNPPDVYLAVEVSAVIDRNDVGRALQRAAVLRSLGYIVVPVVAGEKVTKGGLASAQEDAVAVFQDGKYFYWDESLRGALASA